jgi:dUTP pyrophosphatase
MLKVKIKKLHPDAVIPKYAKSGDAGMDIVATSMIITDSYIEYGTGLSFEIPEGFVGLLFPRSSISKKFLTLSNSVGVLDSGYRGEVTFRFKYSSADNLSGDSRYQIGDRIGQIIVMPFPNVYFEEVGELSDSERGSGGYGSSGN